MKQTKGIMASYIREYTLRDGTKKQIPWRKDRDVHEEMRLLGIRSEDIIHLQLKPTEKT